MSRIVVWISCGASSAVAAQRVLDAVDPGDVSLVYCDTSADEHPDNRRFLVDLEAWLGHPIERISSDRFASVNEVFADRRYMAGIHGAPCTVELKKVPRHRYEDPDDVHVFGFTLDEEHRIERFGINNPEMKAWWILRDEGLSKNDCLGIIAAAGIDIPAMYRLGYSNNNCLGCVKASSPRYWNMIRRDFPDVFDLRASQSREYGARLVRIAGERRFLDELPEDHMPAGEVEEDISCGPDCAIQIPMDLR